MVVKLDLSLHARQGFWYFMVPNLQSWGSCEVNENFPVSCWYDVAVKLFRSYAIGNMPCYVKVMQYVKVELFS